MEVGTVVRSKCGRDKGKFYCVYSFDGNDFVQLVNGKSRRIENPKRKRVKHLEILGLSDLNHKLKQGQKIYDSDIIAILKSFNKSFNGGNNA